MEHALDLLLHPLVLLLGLLAGLPEIARFRRWMRDVRAKLPVHNQWGFRAGRFEKWAAARELHFVQLVFLAIALVLSVLSYILTPKPKTPKPEAAKDLQDPVAEAGKPVPVVFGSLTLKGANAIWFGDKRKIRYKVKPPS